MRKMVLLIAGVALAAMLAAPATSLGWTSVGLGIGYAGPYAYPVYPYPPAVYPVPVYVPLAAYAPIRSAGKDDIPADLRVAIDANPKAHKTFQTLSRQNLFSLRFRTNNMKTAAGRAKKIQDLVAMLARGETIVPQKTRRG